MPENYLNSKLLCALLAFCLFANAQNVSPLTNIDTLKALDKKIEQFEARADRVGLTETLLAKANYLFTKHYYDRALIEANQALMVALDLGREQLLEKVYYLLSQIHFAKGLLFESTEYLYPGYRLSVSIKDGNKISWYLLAISEVEEELGRLTNAIEINLAAIEYFKQIDDSTSLAKIYRSQGLIHTEFGNYATAQNYLEKAIATFISKNDSLNMGKTYRILAYNFIKQSKFLLAERHLKKSESLLKNLCAKELNRTRSLKAELLLTQNNIPQAIRDLKEVIAEQQRLSDTFGTIHSGIALGKALMLNKQFTDAQKTFEFCLKRAEEVNMTHLSRIVYLELSRIEELRGNSSGAFRYIKKYITLTDSLFNIQKISEANRLENISALHQKEKELQAQKENLLVNENKLSKSRFRLYLLLGFTLFLLVMFTISYTAYRNKLRANTLLAEQNIKIEKQKNLLEQRSRDITDSLNYARRIQKAILQTSEQPEEFFQESFLIFIPKELVSGDFYWFKKIDNHTLFALADCTGHGAPGAFMSIIGMFGLNQIVNELKETNPSDVLLSLNKLFQTSFEQKEGSEIFDGMDIAFCNYNPQTGELRYAGANIYLHVVRKSSLPPVSGNILHKNELHTLYQVKCERYSIGYMTERVSFTTHSVQLQKDDIILLFTDGFTDQFGGPKAKKFRPAEFRAILCDIANLPMNRQRDFLLETYSEWKGNNVQVDDVTILGIRIT